MEQTRELLFTQEYDLGEKIVFSLFRSEEKEQIKITLAYRFQVEGAPEVVHKEIMYPKAAEGYQSPYLSWYNLICCSNNYGPIPVVKYMNYAVQNEKKIAATIYPDDYAEYIDIVRGAGEDFYCFPYHVREYKYMLYISRRGTLADYFDMDQILAVYEACNTPLKHEKMEEYFAKELNWYGNEDVCPIEIHNCLGNEELAVVGLLFGYPVESTIALINRTINEY